MTNVLQSRGRKGSFSSEFGAMATRASGLKILVSMVRSLGMVCTAGEGACGIGELVNVLKHPDVALT